MMLGLFKTKSLVDEDSARWIESVFQWALENFDAEVFHHQTQLVLPTNDYFPGRADSVEAMAQNLFDHTLAFAGLPHWSCQLVDQRNIEQLSLPSLSYADGCRGNVQTSPVNQLTIPYNHLQVNDPQTMVSSYATTLGSYLASCAPQSVPADEQQWPLVAELVGIYLGFGVMFANTAFSFKGGCGGCRTAAQSRTAYLSQDEATYALALFCQKKGITADQVTPHLKSHLRSIFKKTLKTLDRKH
ncbi:MAG: hypothetical protein V7677_18260 [Motiliproteus sp.]